MYNGRKLNGNIIGSNEEIIDRNGLLKQTVLLRDEQNQSQENARTVKLKLWIGMSVEKGNTNKTQG